ncbi:MAG: hypothetical protein WC319_12750 [Candidatus Paceibacterota bacterium]|jgi:hypothetical protein
MASQEVISLVVDKIVTAFDSDVALFEAFLTRSRLETEAATLQSAIRKAQAERDGAVTTAETEIQSLTNAYQAKLAEIDAL